MTSRSLPLSLALAALTTFATLPTLAACGGGGAGGDRDSAGQVAANDSSAAESDDGSSELLDVTAADVDAYVRSLEAKLDSLRVGSKRVKAMKDSKQRDSAYVRLAHTLTYYQAMIAASGLGQDRYESVGRDIDNAYQALTDSTADSTQARETLARLRPDALAALKRQAPHMKALYEEQDRLIAEAGGFEKLR